LPNAIVFDQPGPPDVLQWRPVNPLRPKSHEVVIAVEAAGVNNTDIMQRRGAYPVPPDAPKILGLECAGHITPRARATQIAEDPWAEPVYI
jgi:NADPH2:quinone reductase